MKTTLLTLALAAGGLLAPAVQAAELFPLSSVRLGAGPFLDAQTTDLHYLLAFDPDKLLAPFRREAGLPQIQPSYGHIVIHKSASVPHAALKFFNFQGLT